MADFDLDISGRFWNLDSSSCFNFWTVVADFEFWTVVADFELWTLVADFES